MKKVKMFFATIFVVGAVFTAQLSIAQVCTPSNSIPVESGFDPDWEELPCIERNVGYDEVIYFRNFENSVLEYLRVDSINDAPAGLDWAMFVPAGNAQNTLKSGERGCIAVAGTTSAPVGTYKLSIYVCVKTTILPTEMCDYADGLIQTFIDLGQLPDTTTFEYKLRVIESGDPCIVETGINELSTVSGLSIYPNPFSSKAAITFTSAVNAKYAARLVDVMGREVYAETINATTGTNMVEMNRNNISTGVYFFTLSDGKATTTKRVIVE